LTHSSNNLLATVSWEQIKETVLKSAQLSGGNHENGFQIFGPNNYNLNGSNLSDSEKSKLDKVTQGLTPSNLAIAFLGVDETQLGTQSLPGELAIQDQPSTSSSSSETQVDNRQAPAGTPYFAISLTYKPPNQDPNSKLPTQELLEKLNQEGSGYAFTDARSLAAAGTWKNQDAALVAQARSLIDWNERNVVSILWFRILEVVSRRRGSVLRERDRGWRWDRRRCNQRSHMNDLISLPTLGEVLWIFFKGLKEGPSPLDSGKTLPYLPPILSLHISVSDSTVQLVLVDNIRFGQVTNEVVL